MLPRGFCLIPLTIAGMLVGMGTGPAFSRWAAMHPVQGYALSVTLYALSVMLSVMLYDGVGLASEKWAISRAGAP